MHTALLLHIYYYIFIMIIVINIIIITKNCHYKHFLKFGSPLCVCVWTMTGVQMRATKSSIRNEDAD